MNQAITLSLDPNDVPQFISGGRNSDYSMKEKVLKNSWTMFKAHQKTVSETSDAESVKSTDSGSEKAQKTQKTQKTPKTYLQIKINVCRPVDSDESDDGEAKFTILGKKPREESSFYQTGDFVQAIISTNSEEMVKFATHSLHKHAEQTTSFSRKMKTKQSFTFLTAMDHHNIGALIGAGGQTLRNIKEEMYEHCVSNSDYDISEEEGSKIKRTNIRIKEYYVGSKSDYSGFMDHVKSSEKKAFIGWNPDENDEIIALHVNSYVTPDTFANIIEGLKEILLEKIDEIKQRNSRDDGGWGGGWGDDDSGHASVQKEIDTALNA